MKLTVIAVGKLKERAYRDLMDDYGARIRRYVAFQEVEVKNDAGLRRAVPTDCWLVALEVTGAALTSEQLAARLERWGHMGKGHVALLIGGAEGIPADLSKQAKERLSLSTLTLPHRLARVLLAEQLYRGFTILRNEPYAREG